MNNANSLHSWPKTIEAKYDATITKTLPLLSPNSGICKATLVQIQSNTTQKVAFFLDTSEIQFVSPDGSRKFWIHSWWIIFIDKKPIFLILEQESYESYGFYGLDGKSVIIRQQSPFDTEELFTRVAEINIVNDRGNTGPNMTLTSICNWSTGWTA